MGEEDLVGRYYINMAYQAVEHRRYDDAERLFIACEKEFPAGDESDRCQRAVRTDRRIRFASYSLIGT